MIPFDMSRLAQAVAPKEQRLRLRFGTVVSIQDDRTCTVTIGGDTTQVAGIPYMEVPVLGGTVVLATDGLDVFVMGSIATANYTLSPRASRSTNQTIADATDTAISFDGVNSDQWGCWNVGNAALLTAPVTGRYIAVGQVAFAGNATGFRAVWIEKTGTATLARQQYASSGAGQPTWMNVTSTPFDMTAGTDYIRLMVRQTSGAGLDVQSNSTYSPSLSLIYIGP